MKSKEQIAEYVLLLCEKDEIGRKKAMFYLDMSYGELLRLMAARGIAAPEPEAARIDEMAATFAKIHEARLNRLMFLIPDGGPLIRLAMADRLDVLAALQMPLYVIDQVKWELTREGAREDAQRLIAFFRDNPDLVRDFETSVGANARGVREADPVASQRGLTLKALDEMFGRMEEIAAQHGPVLMLFEDWDIQHLRPTVKGDTHLLSTKALLVGMERRGLIPSAEALWQILTPKPPPQASAPSPASANS